jgi:SAM-dependent methyltransferase
MKREVTNVIRYVMDEWLPPVIRDSKLFMYPVFYYWFHGRYIPEIMEFKKKVFYMNDGEYADFYKKIHNRADDRPTDMNQASIDHMLKNMSPDAESLLDVGCGRGYFLKQIKAAKPYDLTGCEIHNGLPDNLEVNFVEGFIERLPFPDKSFDIVTCTHTIEHIIHLKQALEELKRVARKQIMIVTPRQKYYFYTLDLHVNFFPTAELLNREIGLKDFSCKNIQGDWVYIGNIE